MDTNTENGYLEWIFIGAVFICGGFVIWAIYKLIKAGIKVYREGKTGEAIFYWGIALAIPVDICFIFTTGKVVEGIALLFAAALGGGLIIDTYRFLKRRFYPVK